MISIMNLAITVIDSSFFSYKKSRWETGKISRPRYWLWWLSNCKHICVQTKLIKPKTVWTVYVSSASGPCLATVIRLRQITHSFYRGKTIVNQLCAYFLFSKSVKRINLIFSTDLFHDLSKIHIQTHSSLFWQLQI